MSLHFHGVPYRVTNTVVEFEEDRLIAWRHFHRHVWRWELEPAELDGRAGTRVTETFDWARSPFAYGIERLGWPARNARSIAATLRRLQDQFA